VADYHRSRGYQKRFWAFGLALVHFKPKRLDQADEKGLIVSSEAEA
jgi:hypothetical protein